MTTEQQHWTDLLAAQALTIRAAENVFRKAGRVFDAASQTLIAEQDKLTALQAEAKQALAVTA